MEFQSPTKQYGWVCPKCGRANAPWKSYCDCQNNYEITCNNNQNGWFESYIKKCTADVVGSSDYCDNTESHNTITCDNIVDTTWSNSILNDKNAKFTIYIPIDEKGEYK